jgi:GT2 family glycosyltransferase
MENPLVSIIMPAFNHVEYIDEAIESIINQTYSNIQLVIRDDGSTDGTAEKITQWAEKYPNKIVYLGSGENVGLPNNWNLILQKVTGEYVVAIASDDFLYPTAIQKRLEYLLEHPEIDVLTTDFNVIDDRGKCFTGMEKLKLVPQFTRFYEIDHSKMYEELLKGNFIPQFTVMISLKNVPKDTLINDPDCPTTHDYELGLRLAKKFRWGYLNEVTVAYRWHGNNISSSSNIKLDTQTPQLIKIFTKQLFINESIEYKIQILSTILALTKRLHNHLTTKQQVLSRYALDKKSDNLYTPRVSVIIPVHNKSFFTKKCLNRIFTNTPEKTPFEIIVIDNGSTNDTKIFLDEFSKNHSNVKILRNETNIGFAKACNQGANVAKGEYVLFLKNDTEPKAGWLDSLVEVAESSPMVGAVGSKLLFPDRLIKHAGIVCVDDRTVNDPLLFYHNLYRTSPNNPKANIIQEVVAVTAACMLVPKKIFNEVGGFDEKFWNGYEDVDLCLKIGEKGYKIIYQPKSELIHFESQSGPESFTRETENTKLLHQKWLGKIQPEYIVDKDKNIKKTPYCRVKPYQVVKSKKTQPHPLVSIVVLTFNQLDKTQSCLDSIYRYTTAPYEVIVVDNYSKDGTPQFLQKWKRLSKNHKVILNKKNKGFAGGNNQGIKLAKGEYVILLNNDTIVTENWLENLLRTFEKDPAIGLVGPMSNFVAGKQLVPHFSCKTNDEMQEWARKFSKTHHEQIEFTNRLVGFCLAIKRDVISTVGLLDERFGKGNYEDDDYSLRAYLSGYKLAIAKNTFIYHYGNSSFKANNIDYLKSLETNRKIFLSKWETLTTPAPAYIEILLEEAEWQIRQQNMPEAEAALLKAIELDPGNKTLLKKLESIYSAKERFSESLSLLERYAQYQPEDHEVHNAIGMLYWQLNQPQEASRAFKRACELAPNIVDYQKNYADACLAVENFEEAIQTLLHLINQYPSDPEAYQKLAALYVEDGNPAAAYSLMRSAKDHNPANNAIDEWLDALRTMTDQQQVKNKETVD